MYQSKVDQNIKLIQYLSSSMRLIKSFHQKFESLRMLIFIQWKQHSNIVIREETIGVDFQSVFVTLHCCLIVSCSLLNNSKIVMNAYLTLKPV